MIILPTHDHYHAGTNSQRFETGCLLCWYVIDHQTNGEGSQMSLRRWTLNHAGNHDFDFGSVKTPPWLVICLFFLALNLFVPARYAHLTTLVKSCEFPWLLSNIVDSRSGKQPEGLEKFVVF